MFHFERLDN